MSATIRDLFCGAGGSSLGAELAGAELRHGLNHWQRAVETHATNFQHADHSCADIAALTTRDIRRFPPCDILWASPECTNHSVAKGSRRAPPQHGSLFDDGPAGDDEQERSRATMWDVVRFAEQATIKGSQYKAIIVENVVDVAKWGYSDDGGLFTAWLQAMRALGYNHELVYLNSMVCWPTPQSRDRLYIVFWLKTMRAPDLRFEPTCWCPHCEKLVSGQQAWKHPNGHPKLGFVWGKYGQQYLYSCPDCHLPALPAAFPAASVIDWDLPAQRIGDRDKALADNTRNRIKRGLERLDSEPFAIRVMHGLAPKPLTLPLVTLTRRHDMAMVMPVAGNTFERTPGNRARDANVVPLDTVHGTLDRAMIMPYNRTGVTTDADVATCPTLTQVDRAAVVQLQNHGTTTSIEDPVHGVRAAGRHHAIVLRNNNGGAEMSTPTTEPIRTLTSRGHQSLVMANTENGVPRRALSPCQTLRTEGGLAVVVPDEAPAAKRKPHEYTDRDIDDCRFRMFSLPEIAGAMVMDHHTDGGEYTVLGNKRERMAQYGNAVTPPAARELISRVLQVV